MMTLDQFDLDCDDLLVDPDQPLNPECGLWDNLVEAHGLLAHLSGGSKVWGVKLGVSGALANGPLWVNSEYGPALQFDGLNDYVDFGVIPAISGGTQVTLSGSMYRAASGTTCAFGLNNGLFFPRFSFIWYSDDNLYFNSQSRASTATHIAPAT